ncbi:hypothetical protein CBR_g30519 [Chara braunii]|uniref:Uncharacterized protein n=1 Tax=Chara braunii TaxID=69332 RepID=A0A388LCV7_CHABU|nr:hypothetical protein CBR_g30519 [Chara braunii]|eukprot:GBG80151.1 hypothetical protein CBR_g30519 [Chara braunii]
MKAMIVDEDNDDDDDDHAVPTRLSTSSAFPGCHVSKMRRLAAVPCRVGAIASTMTMMWLCRGDSVNNDDDVAV